MSLRKRDVFEVLEPPVGGLTRLRARLGEQRDRRARRWWLVAPIAVPLALLAAFVAWPSPESAEAAAVREAWAAMNSSEGATLTVTGLGAAAVQVPTGNPGVVLYRFAALERSGAHEPRLGPEVRPGTFEDRPR